MIYFFTYTVAAFLAYGAAFARFYGHPASPYVCFSLTESICLSLLCSFLPIPTLFLAFATGFRWRTFPKDNCFEVQKDIDELRKWIIESEIKEYLLNRRYYGLTWEKPDYFVGWTIGFAKSQDAILFKMRFL